MAEQVKSIPSGFHSITPHLTVNGAAGFVDFLKQAFGAEQVLRLAGPGGKLMHVQVRVGDSPLMFADPFPEFGMPALTEGNWPLVLHLCVPDADAAFARAVAAGCKVTMPLADQFWGDRYGQVKDPFGFTWAIASRKEDLTPEQMQQRMDEMFSRR